MQDEGRHKKTSEDESPFHMIISISVSIAQKVRHYSSISRFSVVTKIVCLIKSKQPVILNFEINGRPPFDQQQSAALQAICYGTLKRHLDGLMALAPIEDGAIFQKDQENLQKKALSVHHFLVSHFSPASSPVIKVRIVPISSTCIVCCGSNICQIIKLNR